MADSAIDDLDGRLLVLEETLASAAAGDFQELEVSHDDPLAAVELGVNIVLDDLREQIAETIEANRDLDRKVAERTRQLEERLEQISAQHQLIQRQRNDILALSTPVLQLWDGVIAMPIIGAVDQERGLQIMERLLARIQAGNARYAILDVTGVEDVDTATADHLAKTIGAARMLGTECVLTGVRPGVALSLASLGVDFERTATHRNLQAGLAACLRAMSAARPGPAKRGAP